MSFEEENEGGCLLAEDARLRLYVKEEGNREKKRKEKKGQRTNNEKRRKKKKKRAGKGPLFEWLCDRETANSPT